jgi:hypothetical protein
MSSETRHLVGLLLGTENDWPTAFESIIRRMGGVSGPAGEHAFDVERVTIEPFSLRQAARHDLVIDRLAYWYYHPREWLKKISIMNDVYLLNSPYTFQSMEKHAAYCAMIRLGLKVPETVLVPYKQPVDDEKYAYTAGQYNQPFDLGAVADQLGYPLFMKPFDGGGWRGVSMVRDYEELNAAYDSSGRMLMHLQAAVQGYDVFARSLSIGPETMVMRFDASRPMHDRYQVDHEFLSPQLGDEVVTIGRTVNAFFRWEFNSCETLVRGDDVFPIDYANACPDVALTSLHYYFPWAMKALVRWSVFCTVTGRRASLFADLDSWFEISDQEDLSYGEKLAAYRRLADDHFEADRYTEFCATHLAGLDELVLEYVESPDFDRLLVDTVTSTFPPHEHDHFVPHYRGLLAAWARDERNRLSAVG